MFRLHSAALSVLVIFSHACGEVSTDDPGPEVLHDFVGYSIEPPKDVERGNRAMAEGIIDGVPHEFGYHTIGGHIDVTSSDPGATCWGRGCYFPYGGSVTLTAVPDPGWRLIEMICPQEQTRRTPEVTGDSMSVTLASISESFACRASFIPPNAIAVSVDLFSGGESEREKKLGRVPLVMSSDAAAICVEYVCFILPNGTVDLELLGPLPSECYTGGSCLMPPYRGPDFIGWSCDNGATGTDLPFHVAGLRGNTRCRGDFRTPSGPGTGVLRATSSASDGGTVVVTASVGTCDGTSCSVPPGSSVTFTAQPAFPYGLKSWSCSSSRDLTVRFDDLLNNVDCRAEFSLFGI